ncbi:MAG: hypothetical protein V4538_07130 [Bacteroidota bacterium]
MDIKLLIIFILAVHLVKSSILYHYNKKYNLTITVSDFIAYLISGYFTLYIEKGPADAQRKTIQVLHYTILVLVLGIISYALFLVF